MAAHDRVEQLEAAAVVLLRAVHRRVGLADEVLRGGAAVLGDRDPDAGRDELLGRAELERPGQRSRSCAWRSRSPSRASPRSSQMTQNSSPPKRATVSPGRSASDRRPASMHRSSLPAWWPSESLTSLKRSRSRNSTATDVLRRAAWLSASVRRSMKSVRFGRPVSGSCSAWRCISSSDRRRSIASASTFAVASRNAISSGANGATPSGRMMRSSPNGACCGPIGTRRPSMALGPAPSTRASCARRDRGAQVRAEHRARPS